jgi:hypothetical protein
VIHTEQTKRDTPDAIFENPINDAVEKNITIYESTALGDF